jgi:hypothetical protein
MNLCKDVELKSQDDGVTHLNVYTKGNTVLGRIMSNLYTANIDHPRYGRFRTLEGLWYYLKTGLKDDNFRLIDGWSCRKHGKGMEVVWNNNFQRDFKIGIVLKILANQELKILLTASTLPFVHYYFWGNSPDKMKLMLPRGHEWQMDFWDSMRRQLQEGKDLSVVIEGLMKIDPQPVMV